MGVAAGTGHSIALKNNGTLFSWGINADGQLGDGTTVQKATPASVAGFTGAVGLTAAGNFTLVRREDGSLLRFGRHLSGDALALNLPGWFRTLPEVVPGLHLAQGAPTATLTSAASTVPLGSSVLLTSTVTDADGPPGPVEFLHDGYLLGSDPAAPFTWPWQPPTWGTFNLTAQANDGAGGLSKSTAAISVTVPYDSDADARADWRELRDFATLARNASTDSDGDGVADFTEVDSGFSWYLMDSDGDGLGDGYELTNARNPLFNELTARSTPAANTGLIVHTPAPGLLP